MTEKELIKFYNKNIKITFIDGEVLTGYVYTFTRSVDSDNGDPSISVETEQGYIEVMGSEIDKIEIITL